MSNKRSTKTLTTDEQMAISVRRVFPPFTRAFKNAVKYTRKQKFKSDGE